MSLVFILNRMAYILSHQAIYGYIKRAMPYQAPQSLTNDLVYSLTAYFSI